MKLKLLLGLFFLLLLVGSALGVNVSFVAEEVITGDSISPFNLSFFVNERNLNTVAYYTFDSNSFANIGTGGANWNLSNSGTISSNDGLIASRSFNGTNNVGGSVNNLLDVADLSINLWIKTTNTASQNFFVYAPATSEYGKQFYMIGDSLLGRFYDKDNEYIANCNTSSVLSVSLYDGEWHMVSAVMDGSAKLTLYVDGDFLCADTTFNTYSRSANDQPLLFGNNFVGLMDEVSIYTSILSDSDVSDLYIYRKYNDSEFPIPLEAGSYNVTVSADNYLPVTEEITVNEGLEQTITISDLSNARLNLNATNAFSGNPLSNLSGWIYNNYLDENITYSTTSDSYLANLLAGNYTVFLEAEGYAVSVDNTQEITIGVLETGDLSFSLYTKNSLYINVYDETTNVLITENVSITFSSGAIEFTNYTVTGSFYIDDLVDGEYNIKFSSGNYTQKSYIVTVAEDSTQNLNAYLSTSTDDVLLTIVNLNSGTPIENALVSVERSISGSWVVVESKLSDISGKTSINYVTGAKYRFSISASGYETKLFILDPVLYESYTIKLSVTATVSNAPEYQGIGIFYTPKSFTANVFNNFTFQFTSPQGLFTTYNLSVVYPGGSTTFSGYNALGESFLSSFNITGATLTSTVNITYCYDTSISTSKCFLVKHGVAGVEGAGFKDQTYGMGLFTRIAIATLVIIIVAGLLGLVGGVLIGGFTGLFLAGFLVSIGFIPLWTVLPTLAVGFFLLVGRSSQ